MRRAEYWCLNYGWKKSKKTQFLGIIAFSGSSGFIVKVNSINTSFYKPKEGRRFGDWNIWCLWSRIKYALSSSINSFLSVSPISPESFEFLETLGLLLRLISHSCIWGSQCTPKLQSTPSILYHQSIAVKLDWDFCDLSCFFFFPDRIKV